MGRGFSLLLLLVLLGVLLIAAAAAILASRRWHRRAGPPNRPTRVHDAWAEAGERARMIEDDPDMPDDGDLLAPEDEPPR